MKYFYLLLTCSAFSLTSHSQNKICHFGTQGDGHCGFYKGAEMKAPVDLDEGALLLNVNNRYAYKDYSKEAFNYFLISMAANDNSEVTRFYDVEFQFLDENGEVVFSQFTGGPEPGIVTEQEVYRNEGVTLRIYYAGEKEGNLRFPGIQELVK